jgi:hypothetical protein
MSSICKFFLKGKCKYGDECRFIHNNPVEEKTSSACKFFVRGNCKYGYGCRFIHNNLVKGKKDITLPVSIDPIEKALIKSMTDVIKIAAEENGGKPFTYSDMRRLFG